MAVSEFSRKNSKHWLSRRVFRLRITTLVMLSLVLGVIGIITAQFSGEGIISHLALQVLQENPPTWLKVPRVNHQKYLLLPTITLLVGVLVLKKISPRPRPWSRWLVVGTLLGLTGRYVLWRSLTTLNFADPLNGVFSLGLFCLEMLLLASSSIQLFLMLNVNDRRRQSLAVVCESFTPSVDILIPTYNEPAFILRRTIIGCQALDYGNKKIYLLDDTKRPEIQQLASKLGCEYLTRPDNRYAKAGNLNHAFAKTKGDLVVVFDADFIPTKNFLTRTVGFFQNEKIGLVQTPQSFYNADPIAYNLGLEDVLTPEEEVFYRQIQPIRDAVGSVVCAGTSFVVRRQALEAAGGFVTGTLSEDYCTGIRLAAQGYQVIYLDEKLSAGLAAENIAAYAAQRLRWAQGTVQAFLVEANPLTIPGLRPMQRLAHLEGLLHWFTSFSHAGFLLMPLAYSFLGVIPIQASIAETVYFFLPYYVVQFTVFSWLNYRSRSAMLSNIYSLILCFPIAITIIQVLLNPFSKRFQVTQKGVKRDRFFFNTSLALPLIILFIATAVSLWHNLETSGVQYPWTSATTTDVILFDGISIGWFWSIYNLMLMGISLLILLDAPKPDCYEWFDLRRVVRIDIADQTFWGVTTKLSEVGVVIALGEVSKADRASYTGSEFHPMPVTLEIMEEKLPLSGVITDINNSEQGFSVRIAFEALSLEQQRQLVEMLYCRPGQWKRREAPGELRSLLLLFQILLKPKVLFDRK